MHDLLDWRGLAIAELTPRHISVYGWAATRGLLVLDEAARGLGMTESKVGATARLLVDLELFEPVPQDELEASGSNGPAWRVLHPQVATARLASAESKLRHQLFQLDARRECLAALTKAHPARDEAEGDGPPGSVEVVDSLAEVIAMIERASAECVREVVCCQPGGGRPPDQLEQAIARDTAMLRRGVRMRILYQHTSRWDAPTQAYAERTSALGAEVRTQAQLFGRMIAFDRETVFVPHYSHGRGAAVVRDPSAVAFLCNAFDQTWESAVPFSADWRGTATVDDVRLQILQLLRGGMKDEAIARRLGMSLRTCRKHIADIFLSMGAESRFQAGYLAVRQGLID